MTVILSQAKPQNAISFKRTRVREAKRKRAHALRCRLPHFVEKRKQVWGQLTQKHNGDMEEVRSGPVPCNYAALLKVFLDCSHMCLTLRRYGHTVKQSRHNRSTPCRQFVVLRFVKAHHNRVSRNEHRALEQFAVRRQEVHPLVI